MSEKPFISTAELENLVLELGILSKEDFASAKAYAVRHDVPLYDVLLSEDLAPEEGLGRIVADHLGIPFVTLSKVSIPRDVLTIIPEVVARKQKIVAFGRDENGLHLAMADPTDLQIRDFLERKTGLPVRTAFATERDIVNALRLYTGDIAEAFDRIFAESVREANGLSGEVEAPIVKLVDHLIRYAHENKASDIHLEPHENESTIRFRIDGALHEIDRFPLPVHVKVVSRIKVLAKLRTDEHQTPQDGKIEFPEDDGNLDLRVSIVPLTEGEKVVLRLLSERSRQFSLPNLGFFDDDLEKVRSAIRKPYGMILATGPTGCGKTTTLYAVLKILNQPEVNIMTIEDPVEYDMEGVNQIQVNPGASLTFATGLRSILRQDPNVILVGEIRDEETARIAVNLAMTGHLVLSTLHTNDAATAIPRLLDLGVEPFLIASTVNVVIGQRLVRKIHAPCRVSEEYDAERIIRETDGPAFERVFGRSGSDGRIRLYRGKGCDLCHGTGYEGRIGIFEVLSMDRETGKAVTDRWDATLLRELAVNRGMTTMLEDGLRKMRDGETTLDEVLSATKTS